MLFFLEQNVPGTPRLLFVECSWMGKYCYLNTWATPSNLSTDQAFLNVHSHPNISSLDHVFGDIVFITKGTNVTEKRTLQKLGVGSQPPPLQTRFTYMNRDRNVPYTHMLMLKVLDTNSIISTSYPTGAQFSFSKPLCTDWAMEDSMRST